MGWRGQFVPLPRASDVSGADVLRGPQQGPAPGNRICGFWIRVLAALIDTDHSRRSTCGRFFVVEGSVDQRLLHLPSTTQSTQGGAHLSGLVPHVDRYISGADRLPRCRVALSPILWSQLGGTSASECSDFTFVDGGTGKNIGIGHPGRLRATWIS